MTPTLPDSDGFGYRDGQLHCEDASPRRDRGPLRNPALRVFAPRDRARVRPVRRRARRPPCARLLCDEGQLEPGGARPAGQARGRIRHRLRRRTRTRPRGRRRPAQDGVFRRRQDRGGDRARPGRRHPVLQHRIDARTRANRQHRPPARQACADLGAGQSGRRRRHASVHLDGAEGEQVRRRVHRDTAVVPRCRASPGDRDRRHRLPHRLADHGDRPVRGRRRPRARPCRCARARGHRPASHRLRRRARHPL